MARSAVTTPNKRAKLRELRAKGLGLRPAAKAVGVSHTTAANWEHEDARRGLGKARKSTARATPRRGKASAEDMRVARMLETASLPPPGGDDEMATLREQATLVSFILKRMSPAVATGEYSAPSWVAVATFGQRVAARIAELTPPAPKDPDQDPSTIESERQFLAKIQSMIEESEERVRKQRS